MRLFYLKGMDYIMLKVLIQLKNTAKDCFVLVEQMQTMPQQDIKTTIIC